MKIVINTLTLQCRKSREVVEFLPQITYFHGQISAGKSSIMRLVDYCLGGKLENTPAIKQELVNATLTASLGENEVVFERDAGSDRVQVSWQKSEQETGSVLAPIRKSSQPIWDANIFTLSDLIFYLLGIQPIKVRKSKQREDSQLVSLSFRDIMWYCYLDQDNLDSSFYRMDDSMKRLKSRDAMRFITGYYTERMNELEIQLDRITTERLGKVEAAKQVRRFLQNFGYGEEDELKSAIETIRDELEKSLKNLAIIRDQYHTDTHFADDLRQQLRELSKILGSEETSLHDLNNRIVEQESLKAELLSAKFKLARSTSASSVLTGVRFEHCPSCGSGLQNTSTNELENCYLCKNRYGSSEDPSVPQADIVRRDLTSRIDELNESINQHTRACSKQEQKVDTLKVQKSRLDQKLNRELSTYDSAYLSTARKLERRIATLQERQENLNKSVQMLESITQLEEEAKSLREKQEDLRKEIEAEKNKLGEAENRVKDIEEAYLDALLATGVPGVQSGDVVKINRRTWMPWIIPKEGGEGAAYTFYNAGSGGKKTLLNVCYALSVHRVAIENGLHLPTFLMVDTPMKNIGEDVNQDIFDAFYNYLYGLASNSMSDVQFILVDKEYSEPPQESGLAVKARYMSPQQPLISYYQGP